MSVLLFIIVLLSSHLHYLSCPNLERGYIIFLLRGAKHSHNRSTTAMFGPLRSKYIFGQIFSLVLHTFIINHLSSKIDYCFLSFKIKLYKFIKFQFLISLGSEIIYSIIMSKKNENSNHHYIPPISLNVESDNHFAIGVIPEETENTIEKEKSTLPTILKNMGLTLDSDLEFSSSNNDGDLTFNKQTFKTLNLFSHIPKERTTQGKDIIIPGDTDETTRYLLGVDVKETDYLRNIDRNRLIAYYNDMNPQGKKDMNHEDEHDEYFEKYKHQLLVSGLQQLFPKEDVPFSIELKQNQLAALIHFYQLHSNDTISFANEDISLVKDYYQGKEDQIIDHCDFHKFLIENHFQRLCEDPPQTDSMTIDQIKSLIHYYKTNEKQSDRETFHKQLINQTKKEKNNKNEIKTEKQIETKEKNNTDNIVVTNIENSFAIPDEYKPKKFGQICEDTIKFWHHM